MRTTHHPYTFSVERQFPNARHLGGWEGGGAHTAERDGKWFIIIDEGTMADFLDENDPSDREVMNRLVTVFEFDTRAERDAHAASVLPMGSQPAPPPKRWWQFWRSD